MYNTDIQLHFVQTEILNILSLNTNCRFNDLVIPGLESEHINYHLKRLVGFGLVVKKEGKYILTDAGKDYSNMMDSDLKVIEKQPKTSILINGVRKNSETGEVQNLLCKRLKQPYYGKVGRLGGKVRFGESLYESVKRELFEETGLEAKNFVLEEIYHKIRYSDKKEVVQDVLFYIFFVTGFSGTLISDLPYQENLWISKKELSKRKDIDLYDSFVFCERMEPKKLTMSEDIGVAEGY